MTHNYIDPNETLKYLVPPAGQEPRSTFSSESPRYKTFPRNSLAPEQANKDPAPSILAGSSSIPKDPLERFFHAKRTNHNRSIEDIVALIEQREKLRERNLYQILLNECQVLTRMHEIEHWSFAANPLIETRRSICEKELLDFDKQRRLEEVAAWKDTLTLKSDLRELLQELYKDQTQRALTYGLT